MTFRGPSLNGLVLFGCLITFLFYPSSSQLVINVKNQGGDILQETLSSNLTEDVVKLEFQKSDGSVITQLLDFRKEVQIHRVIILNEDEQMIHKVHQPPYYQVVCFVSKLSKQDFIAADAIAKLRQKNPHTVRYPEEDHGKENGTFEYSFTLAKSHVISFQIAQLCSEALAVYAQESDLKLWAATGNDALVVLDAAKHLSKPGVRCRETSDSTVPCQCRLNFCVPWYPCGLKFCRSHDQQTGKALSYRCGIKTCKKCLDYQFPVANLLKCPWDV